MMTVPGELSRVSTLVDIAGRRIFSNIFSNGGGMVLLPVGGDTSKCLAKVSLIWFWRMYNRGALAFG